MGRQLNAVLTGVAIALLVIAYWYYWAMIEYQWSDERLGSLMLAKYQGKNNSSLTDDQHFRYTDVNLDRNRKYVTARMQKKNKITQAVVSEELVRYNITGTNCEGVDFTCI